MDSLARVAKTWQSWGKKDPLFAICSAPAAYGGKWDLDQFFASGESEIADIMQRIDMLGVPVRRSHAFDFGCGAGRLSRGLARYFDQVTGVDIAPAMIALAKEHNPGDQFNFLLNARPDLQVIPDASVDFIYSAIVLQHMPPPLMKGYIREFVRVLSPGGVMSVHVPCSDMVRGNGWKDHLRRLLGRNYDRIWAITHGTTAIVEMHWIATSEMQDLLTSLGVEVLAVDDILPNPIRRHARYICRKP